MKRHFRGVHGMRMLYKSLLDCMTSMEHVGVLVLVVMANQFIPILQMCWCISVWKFRYVYYVVLSLCTIVCVQK